MLVPKKIILDFIDKSVRTQPAVWNKSNYAKGTIIFNQGETTEKIFFVKKGILQLFKYDRNTNTEHTIGFVFANDAYVPLSALSNWCPALAGMRAIDNENIVMEIYISDWLNLMGKKDKNMATMQYYLISMGIYWVEDLTDHFIFDQAHGRQAKKNYYEMKKQKHQIIDSNIATCYLASYFQIHSKSFEKIKQDYLREQREAQKNKKK